MRKNVKKFVKLVSEVLTIQEPVYEIGSLLPPGQMELADLRTYFPGKEYVGCDMQAGQGVDRIEDVENLSLQSETVGTVLMMDTLEHIKNCHRALDEIHRVLKPGGTVIMTSVMDFFIHCYPSDYWRFTPHAFDILLDRFSHRFIFSQGFPIFPHTIFGVGIKSNNSHGEPPRFEALESRLKEISSGVPAALVFKPLLSLAQVLLISKLKITTSD